MQHAATNHDRRDRASGPRQVVEFAICLLVTVLLSRTWFIESYVVPSSSMAGSLLGVHREAHCPECGHDFRCGTDDLREQTLLVACANCGRPHLDLTDQPDVNGDRLVVFKSAYAARAPERWEVVVFRYPEEARKAFIKRVVGLPGEAVQVADGEVYVDGQLARKSLEEQRALAVLVHDSADTPGLLPPRWNADRKTTAWRFGGGRFVRTPSDDASEQEGESIDWLTYRHWRRVTGGADESAVEEAPIMDLCPYNLSRSQKVEDANLVTDLLLSARLRTQREGRLSFFLTDGREQFLLHLEPLSGRVDLLHAGRPVAATVAPHPLFATEAQLEVSLVDRQVLVAVDGQLLLPPYRYEAADLPLRPTSRPVAIGAVGLEVELSALRLYRDVYYTRPPAPYGRWALDEPYRLADDEYFVLGDNSPLSDDSRLWPGGPAVQQNLLVGKPLVVHVPSRLLWWNERPWQVPDLARIRYIR